MYLRFTQRTNADGSVVWYAALAHNRRVDGKVGPDVLMNLGRVDQLDVDGLRRLAASITRHFDGDREVLAGDAEASLMVGASPGGSDRLVPGRDLMAAGRTVAATGGRSGDPQGADYRAALRRFQ